MQAAEETGRKPSDESITEQIIRLNNERFSVPELLFTPSDVGIHQCGIPETIVESVMLCEPEASNIVKNIKKKQSQDLHRVRPRFFDQVGHDTMCASSGNKHLFTKSCHRQTWKNYEQPP